MVSGAMRIAAFSPPRTNYRSFEPLDELVRRGHQLTLETEAEIKLSPEVLACDLVFVHRYQGRNTRRQLARLREAGLPVVWDHDDNVAVAQALKRGGLRAQEAVADTRAMVRLVDVVTTTNELLAERYREAGARAVHVVPNYLPRSFDRRGGTSRRGPVRIGWIAWADPQRDWNELGLREIALRLLDAHPHVTIESVGPIDLQLGHERYVRTGPVQFGELPARIAAFDVGIALLQDVPFNAWRSDVKLKEYAALGVPWLASPVGPYRGHGEDQGGLLVPDDGWEAALTRIVEDGRLRRKLSKAGSRWARGHRLKDHVGEWEAAFEAARAGFAVA